MVIFGIGDNMTIKQLCRILYEFIKDMGTIITPIIALISFACLYNPWYKILEPYFIIITIITLVISFIFSVIKIIIFNFKNRINVKFKNPNFEIEVKFENLFQEKSNLVIGFNNYFDTQMPEVISPNSIQGQFEQLYYKDNIDKLNSEILNALKRKKCQSIKNNTDKVNGKRLELPIGTTITISNKDRKFFLTAYSKMSERCMAESNITYLTIALNELWDEIRNSGQCNEFAMPVLGSGLARISVGKMALLCLILLSFITSSKEQIISNKLTITLNKKDKKIYKLSDIEIFLKNLQR